MGYTAMKFDPFGAGGREMSRTDLRAAVKAVEVVRDAAGTDVDLLIECHGRFSVGTAIEAIKAMQPYEPLFCEEPIPAHNIDSQAWVTKAASAMGARVATGEHTYSRFGFNEMLQKQASHVVQPDLGYAGGSWRPRRSPRWPRRTTCGCAAQLRWPGQADGLDPPLRQYPELPDSRDLRGFRCRPGARRLVKGGEPRWKMATINVPTRPPAGATRSTKRSPRPILAR